MAVNLINSNDINVVQSDTDISLETNKTTLNTIIDSRINNYMTYSTTEQRAGTWIDGKPLYRKVIPITNPQSSNTNYEDVSGLNISSLVHLYGFYKGASGNIFDIPFHDSESNYSVIFLSDAGYIRGRFGNPTSISEIKVIIEYTKTTD